jgi:hypothetical protein
MCSALSKEDRAQLSPRQLKAVGSEEWTSQSLALLRRYWQAVNADTRDLLKRA